MLASLDFTTLVLVIITLIISITIHEAMHAFTSNWLGDDTAKLEGRITLNPVKHVDPFLTILLPIISVLLLKQLFLVAKPVPFNPYRVKYEEFGAALVALAGPFTNLFLAIVGAGFLNLFKTELSLATIDIVLIFITINVGLFIFNMLPIPPLDGSRLVYAVAPEPVQRVMAGFEQFGIFVILFLVVSVPAFGQLISDLNSQVLDFLIR